MPSTLPRQDTAREVQRSKAHGLLALTRRSLAEMATSLRAEVWSVASEQWLDRAELPQPLRQRAASSGSASAHRDTGQHAQSSASGLFGHLEEVRLWKFVGRAGDPC